MLVDTFNKEKVLVGASSGHCEISRNPLTGLPAAPLVLRGAPPARGRGGDGERDLGAAVAEEQQPRAREHRGGRGEADQRQPPARDGGRGRHRGGGHRARRCRGRGGHSGGGG